MLKRLIIVINKEDKAVSLGKAMNAVGHMAIGMSPRFQKSQFPFIEIYAGNTEQVRQFKKEAYLLNQRLTNNQSVYSDFAHTTTEGDAKSHEQQTRAIKEADITYFAACICAEDKELAALDEMLKSEDYMQLKGNTVPNQKDKASFDFQAPISYPEDPSFTDLSQKFSISLTNTYLNTADAILAVVKATIDLGLNTEDKDSLRLHQYADGDHNLHQGMSEHSLVVLKAKGAQKLDELQKSKDAHQLNSIGACTGANDKLLAVSVFGDTNKVNEATKKSFNLWSEKLKIDTSVVTLSVVKQKVKPHLDNRQQQVEEVKGMSLNK